MTDWVDPLGGSADHWMDSLAAGLESFRDTLWNLSILRHAVEQKVPRMTSFCRGNFGYSRSDLLFSGGGGAGGGDGG